MKTKMKTKMKMMMVTVQVYISQFYRKKRAFCHMICTNAHLSASDSYRIAVDPQQH